jgi:uncharacterized protein (TIGR03435 family)
MIIATAYNVPFQQGGNRLSGVPEWALSERFDIEATAGKSVLVDGETGKARGDKIRLMLQTLLADRFKMVVRRETKELPVYVAAVGKNGTKLEKSKVQEKDCPETGAVDGIFCHSFIGGSGRGLHGAAVDMSDLVGYVQNYSDRPIIDKTGIKGLYKIETAGFTPPWQKPATPGDSGVGEDGVPLSDRPTLFTIFDKLGLKLESQKAPVEMYVIEHIERPTAN